MWSPNSDKNLNCTPTDFIAMEKSNPEALQALFEKMELCKTRIFVLKNAHNAENDNYELKVVFVE